MSTYAYILLHPTSEPITHPFKIDLSRLLAFEALLDAKAYLLIVHIFLNNLLFGVSCLTLSYLSAGVFPLAALAINTHLIFQLVSQNLSEGENLNFILANLVIHGPIETVGLFYFIICGIRNGFSVITLILGNSTRLSRPRLDTLILPAGLLLLASILESMIIINQS